MSIFEYDQEKHIKQEREAAWEEGKKAGERDMLLKLAEKKLRQGKTIAEIAEELEESEKTIKEILESRKE
jgi:DNA-binding NarL/FixJ family response regulator